MMIYSTYSAPAAFSLAARGMIVPSELSAVSTEEWLDAFSTELTRLRPHLGYTGAQRIARILCRDKALKSPLAEARIAAEELQFMSEVDSRPRGARVKAFEPMVHAEKRRSIPRE